MREQIGFTGPPSVVGALAAVAAAGFALVVARRALSGLAECQSQVDELAGRMADHDEGLRLAGAGLMTRRGDPLRLAEPAR